MSRRLISCTDLQVVAAFSPLCMCSYTISLFLSLSQMNVCLENYCRSSCVLPKSGHFCGRALKFQKMHHKHQLHGTNRLHEEGQLSSILGRSRASHVVPRPSDGGEAGPMYQSLARDRKHFVNVPVHVRFPHPLKSWVLSLSSLPPPNLLIALL